MAEALAGVAAVAIVTGGGLVAFRWWLAFKGKTLEHAPLADMQRKLDELENRLLSQSMKR